MLGALFPKKSMGKNTKQVSSKHDCEHDMWAMMEWATSSANIRKWAKRETAIVSYSILDASLTGCIIQWHLHPFLNMTLWCLIFNMNRSKLHPVRSDEWFNRLRLKPDLWPPKCRMIPSIIVHSLYFCSSSYAHATSGSWHRHLHITFTVMLAHLLALRSSQRIFKEKRDC